MAFLEIRKFTFFDVHENVDNGKIAEGLQDSNVTVATSGNGHIVLCDATGWVHLISRSWEITPFKAYEMTISLAQQLPHDPFLVTIGEDEPGVNPMIKVWDWSRTDRHGNPIQARISRAVPSHMRPVPATALAVHENKSMLAVGFEDGCVSIFRGDIRRQRSFKMNTLTECGTQAITGLFFKGADKLFVVSRSAVLAVWVAAERVVSLSALGAPPACSALTDKHQLTVAYKDAIYCYTSEGKGACYALEGEKVQVNWFRSYLVLTTNETKTSASTSTDTKSHNLTILDIQNKFIVFSKKFDEIQAVLTEWGSFYILTKKKGMIYLEEKDLQSKLSMLFKKNFYDVAIRIASSQHYDAQGLTEIYKQYADHLYSKGDLKTAIEHYVKTIGWLETSYVIKKYLESRHLEPLVLYLEELHKKGYATEDHTTLLLTCYVKIDQQDQQGKLKEFINSKNKAIDFDVDVAIKVVRQVSVEDALSLAANHKQHDWYLKIMIEDKKDFKQALDYIEELEFEDADTYMRKYGHQLIQHVPEESTRFLKLLCTEYAARSAPLVREEALGGAPAPRAPDRAAPDHYIHMFLSNSEQLIDFLEHMIRSRDDCSSLVFDALIEHYIHVWAKSPDSEKKVYEDKVLKLLKDPEAHYDKDQTLIICQMLGFRSGVLHLYEENKLWRGQVCAHMRGGAAEQALRVCGARGGALWLDLLWTHPPPSVLPTLLHNIDKEKLLSPILVVDCLASAPSYTLGDVRKYLTDVLSSEAEVISREAALCDKYRGESARMKQQLAALRTRALTFQSSRCALCNKTLELPTVHFLCQHSFHQHCFQSYSEAERECPLCAGARAPPPPHSAETLHARLAHHDPYAVVSEYYGRGLFNKVTLITESEPPPAAAAPPPAPAPAPAPALAPALAPAALNYGPGAEAKLRLGEGQSKQVYVPPTTKPVAPKTTPIVPIPEGRMRMLEQTRYSSSLEANMNRLEPKPHKKSPVPSPKNTSRKPEVKESQNISSAIANEGNPFEEKNYDESKNPFAEDEANDPTNPFNEEDDYDKNLNPFS